MRNNVIAFGLLFVFLGIEVALLFQTPFYQVLFSNSGECRGTTTYYNYGIGHSRWDCDGNRLPDKQQDDVGIQVSPPPEIIVHSSTAVREPEYDPARDSVRQH